ncbi:NADP-dependent oxidoreductase [Actinocatenispora thailandica]|uniref:NADP-dependent oxidoreductase n=1 Tax=Actinocatenispora thailandica TaxID=227318 RepID=A0A7R7DWG3_9ACTN|nr:NADP-dependent oxidoreductase [Actinocatenispora thailandica]
MAARPDGWPTAETFELATVEVPAPADGQVLVRNTLMSVDPYMRGRMNDVESYVPPFEVGRPLDGGAIGEVVESRSPRYAVGDTVLHGLGWRDYALLDADHAVRVDPAAAPVSSYLGILGMTGLTAYAGLVAIAALQPGETVFVSGAAGAVGSAAGQFARLLGAGRVVGSAGTAAKVRYLTDELGFDAAFDYHDGPVARQLRAAAPDGIDVYFDNVGGEHLEAAIGSMKRFGRAAICGMISGYNETEPQTAPRNLARLIGWRLTLRGFLVRDHADLRDEFVERAGRWLADGKLSYRETFADGLPNAPQAFLDMMRGGNIGKMLVRLSPAD